MVNGLVVARRQSAAGTKSKKKRMHRRVWACMWVFGHPFVRREAGIHDYVNGCEQRGQRATIT